MSLENSSDFLLNLSVRDVIEEDKHFYRFKIFRLDVAERRLLKSGVPVPLMPKVFDVLALLVERHGHLVEKTELLNTVWADTFVEETNITRIIHELRKVLGEDGNGNKYIETVPKKGYRFVAEVEEEINEPPAPNTRTENGKYSTPANELPASELTAPIAADASDLPLSPAFDETRLISKPKQHTRIILFGVGFLSAVFLLLLMSLNFRSDSAAGKSQS
jgi:DNA-binding winged helix-turn-helix (wHTH) protein